MSIIIRLQNLPWAATCMDIRRYFWGLSIPEGGVHIVGGEMGDAFIGFSTDEDARQAMSRDGGKIHEMQIRLLLSSHAEMMRVIEKARQQNVALQSQAPVMSMPQVMPAATQPMMPSAQQQMMPAQAMMPTAPQPPMMPVPQQQQQPVAQQQLIQEPNDRRRRSPSPGRRPRDRSPGRGGDRSRRSSSKRDRSRSPPRGSRAGSSDYRRGKRDDRGYDDRYRDDRYRKYPDNSRDRRYYDSQAGNSPTYGSYDRSKSSNAYSSSSNNDKGPSQSQQMPSNNSYGGSSGGNSYDHSAMSSNSSKQAADDFPKRRRSRFDPEPATTSSDVPFFDAEQKNKLAEALRALPNLVSAGKPAVQEYSSGTNTAWPQQTSQESHPQSIWPKLEKRHPNQGVVPMDLESSPTSSPPGPSSKIVVNAPFNAPRDPQPIIHSSNDMPSRHHPSERDQKDRFMAKQNQPQWSTPNPVSLTVEVRGPPPDVKVNEVLDLFHSAPLSPANVFILKNQRGEADKALVQFQKMSDAQMALSRQPCYIRSYCCEVVSCPDALFKAALNNAITPLKSFKPRAKEEDWCVQMSGFTFPCSEADIARILGGLRIVDLVIDDEKGCAFVQLSSEQDFHCALSMSGKMFGQGYITINGSSKEFLNAARGSTDRRGPTNTNYGGPPHHGQRPFNNNPNGPINENGPPGPAPHNRPQNYAIHLRQLPQHVTDKAINEFFKEAGVIVKAIHILLTPEKVPSGEGFIEVGTKGEVDIALTRHNSMFLGRPILVSPIPFHEMNLILNPPGLLPTPDEELSHRGPERPYDEPEFEGPPNGRPPRKDYFDGPPMRGERPYFPPDRPRPDFRGERPFFPRQRGERSRMDGPPMRGPRPPMRPPFNRMRGPFPQRPRGPPWDPSRAREQGEIGAPGCVVNIDNLHFDAGFEEILEFFKGYGILRDNIIRKYDERKQPTSKARVAFHNPWDAERAVRELNHQKIKGRSLNLSIL